ncbi:hypothetical protein GCK72_003730 [Caenorhabditis remanei]|uniref:Uncharacterized protein n=1 Tax=Caenorhabditis remanei TaxID=31234 RepID=A0A6A5H9C9_CAERE|nr:hypothetical protein GCK72_003730 [Caenorhabditis remanei]KAF1763785.1 hypothetical protein GCK72_003730 [Caenorhabditis remanei]
MKTHSIDNVSEELEVTEVISRANIHTDNQIFRDSGVSWLEDFQTSKDSSDSGATSSRIVFQMTDDVT